MVDNVERDIQLFTKSMSSSDTTRKGSDLVEAFKRMLPTICLYLLCRSTRTGWKTLSDGPGSSVTDCAIQPTMLLSHHSALAFNQMRTGHSLLSPDGKAALIVPCLRTIVLSPLVHGCSFVLGLEGWRFQALQEPR